MAKLNVIMMTVLATGPTAVAGNGWWVSYANETGSRLVAEPSLGVVDAAEKDYAWGDFDRDGDIDLAVARKQPFTTAGKRPNVLLMNEAGVLVDRTAQFASAAINLPEGVIDQGFLTPTNDRDIVASDVNGDGWLDVVTAATNGDGEPKHISHPRVYVNQGNRDGLWQGFVFDNARMPLLLTHPATGTPQPATPRFESVAAGDVTGDGLPDLYFGDSDFVPPGMPSETPATDLNQKLLINDGSGSFTDETATSVLATVTGPGIVPPMPFWNVPVSTQVGIVDFDGDGVNDLIEVSVITPTLCAVAFNDPRAPGAFSTAQIVAASSDVPVQFAAADVNNDARPDFLVFGDNVDVLKLNLSTTVAGQLALSSMPLPSGTSGFPGEGLAADLDGDGFLDAIVSDVNFDISPCMSGRVTDILRHNGVMTTPGLGFTGGATTIGSPQQVGGISNSMLTGVHDAAVFDIDGDCRLDLVIGRCTSTEIWINDALKNGCMPTCPADLDESGGVDGFDLAMLLAAWGQCAGCAADLDASGVVNGFDLAGLLADWGDCAR